MNIQLKRSLMAFVITQGVPLTEQSKFYENFSIMYYYYYYILKREKNNQIKVCKGSYARKELVCKMFLLISSEGESFLGMRYIY